MSQEGFRGVGEGEGQVRGLAVMVGLASIMVGLG